MRGETSGRSSSGRRARETGPGPGGDVRRARRGQRGRVPRSAARTVPVARRRAPRGRRQRAERRADHDRHPARGPSLRLRLRPGHEPAHRRPRLTGDALRAGLHLLAEDPRQLRHDHDGPEAVAERLRQDAPRPAPVQPDPGQRPPGRRLPNGGRGRQPQRGRPERLLEGLRDLPGDLGGEGARHRDRPRARHHRGGSGLPAPGEARPALLPLAALREPPRPLHSAAAFRHEVRRRVGGGEPAAGRGARASTAGSRGSGPCPGRTASATTSRSTTARSLPSTRRSAA